MMKRYDFVKLTSVTSAALLAAAACGGDEGNSDTGAAGVGSVAPGGSGAVVQGMMPPSGSGSTLPQGEPAQNAVPPGSGMVTEEQGGTVAAGSENVTPPSTPSGATTTETQPPAESEGPTSGAGSESEAETEAESNAGSDEVPGVEPSASMEMPMDETPAMPVVDMEGMGSEEMESEGMVPEEMGGEEEESLGGEDPGSETADTWDNFAQNFFVSYCGPCHDDGGVGAGGGLYYDSADVMDDADPIACGITLSEEYRQERGCNYGRSAGQFPAGNGPKPSDEDRERIVAWIDAGMP